MKIFAATIEHKHGTNHYTSATQEGLDAEIAEYVEEWWETEIGGEMPTEPAEAIETYFDYMMDRNSGEYLTRFDPEEVTPAPSDSEEWFIALVDDNGDRYWSGTYGGGFGIEEALSAARLDCSLSFRPDVPGFSFEVRPIGESIKSLPY